MLQPGNLSVSGGNARQLSFTGFQLETAALIYSIEATLVLDLSKRRRQVDGEVRCALLLVGNDRKKGPVILLASNPVRYIYMQHTSNGWLDHGSIEIKCILSVSLDQPTNYLTFGLAIAALAFCPLVG